ncbi:hypothetical protein [Edaphobacter sp.]|uniref:hypothetical protein n=1 Tax=Edaphobacter sp. TaxID=1934404 RepID=UPI002DBBC823|nr:hypothetical protein [Edaphobacter sp.]HEU5341549.1 hypothetical protein [Edaphobacter sp.]
MKILAVLFLSLFVPVVCAQTVPTNDQIFAALYGSHYNPETKVATWHCPQETATSPDECISKTDSVAKIDLMLMHLIEVDGTWKAFVVTSAIVKSYTCHACQPPIVAAVFAFRDHKWQVESQTENNYQFGAFGDPASSTLVKIGPKLYGFMFTLDWALRGYEGTQAQLLAPVDKTVQKVWSGSLYEDNSGDYDPTGKIGSSHRIHFDAAYRVVPIVYNGFYLFQIVGRGNGNTYRSGSGTFTYHFLDGEYRPMGKHWQLRSRP